MKYGIQCGTINLKNKATVMLLSTEEQILRMFKQVHQCDGTVIYDNDNLNKISCIALIKAGQFCWSVTIQELMFDYLVLKNEGKI